MTAKAELRWTRTTKRDERPILGTLHVIGSNRQLGQSTLAEVATLYPGEVIRVDFTPWPD